MRNLISFFKLIRKLAKGQWDEVFVIVLTMISTKKNAELVSEKVIATIERIPDEGIKKSIKQYLNTLAKAIDEKIED